MKKIFYLLLILPFLYSCSDEDNEGEIRNEKIIQAIKAIDEYKDAFNFRNFKEGYTNFEDLNWYKAQQAHLKQYEDYLKEAIEEGDKERIERLQRVINEGKQSVEYIRANYTKPYYVVTFDTPRYDPNIQLYYIATLNKDFVFLGLFE